MRWSALTLSRPEKKIVWKSNVDWVYFSHSQQQRSQKNIFWHWEILKFNRNQLFSDLQLSLPLWNIVMRRKNEAGERKKKNHIGSVVGVAEILLTLTSIERERENEGGNCEFQLSVLFLFFGELWAWEHCVRARADEARMSNETKLTFANTAQQCWTNIRKLIEGQSIKSD